MASNPHSMSIKQDLSSPFTDEDTEAQRTQPEVTEFLGTINLPQAQEAEMKRAAARAASGGDKTSTLHSLSFWQRLNQTKPAEPSPGPGHFSSRVLALPDLRLQALSPGGQQTHGWEDCKGALPELGLRNTQRHSPGTQTESVGPACMKGRGCQGSAIHNSQRWKQPNCPSRDEWKTITWQIHTMEYWSVRKRNAVLTCATMWMNLKNIIPNERSQTQRPAFCDPVI